MEQYIGPNSIGVIGLCLLAIATGAKGIWQFSYQTERQLAERDKRIADLEKQIEEQRIGSAERLDEMRKDRDEYRSLVFTVLDLGKTATAVAEKSVNP